MNLWQIKNELLKIKGIGDTKATKIASCLGEDALTMIAADPDVLMQIQGIKQKDLDAVVDYVVGQQKRLTLRRFLIGNGMDWITDRVFDKYGADSEKIIRHNPYLLLDCGARWEQADALYLSYGNLEDDVRIAAGLDRLLRKAANDGHSFLPRTLLTKRLSNLLGVRDKTIQSQVDHKLALDGNAYVEDLVMIEEAVAKMLRKLQQGEGLELRTLPGLTSLSNQQFAAVHMAGTEKVSILTGGPGTGKTTTLKALIRLLKANDVKTALCAPTGRAAKRMAEVTGEPASTIHRLLGYNPQEGWKFNERTPLECDFIIIDEASMLDVVLLYHLLHAIPHNAGLLLLGDVDQLPSVGPGRVLSDLLASGKVPATRLTEIYRQRQDSGIVVNAHRINQGIEPEYHHNDFQFIPADNAWQVNKTIVELAVRHPDVTQVLSPMYRGPAGVDKLNESLQNTLNPRRQGYIQSGGREFRLGDKVMQTRNNYDKGAFNGDVGRVVRIEFGSVVVAYEDEFGPLYAEYKRPELDELSLAYCTTVHKSQGGEYPVVIIPLVLEHSAMLQRNLLYTAVTRAKNLCILVGQRSALQRAIENDRGLQRNTTLVRALHE